MAVKSIVRIILFWSLSFAVVAAFGWKPFAGKRTVASESNLKEKVVPSESDLKETFNYFDLDGDGKINADDLYKGMLEQSQFTHQPQIAMTKELAVEYIQAIGPDEEGKVSRDAFCKRIIKDTTEPVDETSPTTKDRSKQPKPKKAKNSHQAQQTAQPSVTQSVTTSADQNNDEPHETPKVDQNRGEPHETPKVDQHNDEPHKTPAQVENQQQTWWFDKLNQLWTGYGPNWKWAENEQEPQRSTPLEHNTDLTKNQGIEPAVPKSATTTMDQNEKQPPETPGQQANWLNPLSWVWTRQKRQQSTRPQ